MAKYMLYIIGVISITICFSYVSAQTDCESSGSMTCNGKEFQTFNCSPPVLSPTAAKLTNNDFEEGGDGGSQSSCDKEFHLNSELVVALSTGWFAGGSRCGNKILITASTGATVEATVVDECDSMQGCDKEHAGLPPCDNNIVDGSNAVWEALGLDTKDGIVDITWSMV